MSRVIAREVRRGTPQRDRPSPRGGREFRDVRDPRRPDLRVELVRICPSGVHVVTSVPEPATPVSGAAVVEHSRDAAVTVADLLPARYRDRVRPVLLRTDDAEVADLVDGVLVTSRGPLEHILRSSPVVLSTSEVTEVGLRLGTRFEPFPVAETEARRRRRRWPAVVAALGAAAGVAAAVAQGAVPLPLP